MGFEIFVIVLFLFYNVIIFYAGYLWFCKKLSIKVEQLMSRSGFMQHYLAYFTLGALGY